MSTISVMVAISDPVMVWDILEADPVSKFQLIMLHQSNLPSEDPGHVGEKKWFRIEQWFDPMTDQGTEIVNMFSKKTALELHSADSVTRIWIVAYMPAPHGMPMPGVFPGNKPV